MKFILIAAVFIAPIAQAEVVGEIRFKAKVLKVGEETSTLLYAGKKVRVPTSSLSAEARKSRGNREIEVALNQSSYDHMGLDYLLGE